MKKLIALLLAATMIMAMSLSALAAGTGSITVKPSDTVDLDGKTLTAYKILDATYSGSGEDLKIAYSIPDDLLPFFNEYFGDGEKTASELAAEAGKTVDVFVTQQMETWANNGEEIKKFEYAILEEAEDKLTPIAGTADGDNIVFTELDAGYYLIKDESTEEPVSMLMLDTVTDEEVEITLKATDKSEKEILTAAELVNNKADELGLGRAVNYVYTNAVPDTTGYDYYYYMVNDTLSEGLTFVPESVVVKVGDTELTKGTDYHLYYASEDASDEVLAALGDKTFIVAFENMKEDVDNGRYETGDDIKVYYSGIINEKAVCGVDPNNNEAHVTYSRNPDKSERGDAVPGIPANTEEHPVGDGPKRFTDSYTTKVTVIKIDGESGDPLEGVEFTLTGTSKDVVVDLEEVYEINPNGEYWLLNNGKYTNVAPQTEPELIETTGNSGWVEDDAYTGTDGRVVGEHIYRPYKKSDGSTVHYIIKEPNGTDYASTTIKYEKVVKSGPAAEDYDVTRVGTTDADGELSFAQLGAGTFTLTETGILPGYNGIEDIEFEITCTLPDPEDVIAGTEQAVWSIVPKTEGVDFDEESGTFTVTIENNSGTELPSTGGMGTTIFYIVGSVLVIGAAVLLISKRRMNVR